MTPDSVFSRVVNPTNDLVVLLRDVLVTTGVVAVVGLLLFVSSGVWPPLVAVESGSMEPHMVRGDLVYVSEPGRFSPEAGTEEVGVITAETGRAIDYESLGGYGSVVVYRPPGYTGSPIIHRAMFRVEAGENWYDEVNTEHVRADNCRELRNCPAPHAGLITKGDANSRYDQAAGVPPVRPEWIRGTAHARVPSLGRIRLLLGAVVTS